MMTYSTNTIPAEALGICLSATGSTGAIDTHKHRRWHTHTRTLYGMLTNAKQPCTVNNTEAALMLALTFFPVASLSWAYPL